MPASAVRSFFDVLRSHCTSISSPQRAVFSMCGRFDERFHALASLDGGMDSVSIVARASVTRRGSSVIGRSGYFPRAPLLGLIAGRARVPAIPKMDRVELLPIGQNRRAP
jgi:hypothetical protein